MLKVGITGQAGFIGSHLAEFFRIKEDVETVPFIRNYFADPARLEDFVCGCDVIIQLAAMSRCPDGKVLYDTNIGLDKKLIAALRKSGSRAHVIFASTTHENREGEYYASKRDGQKLFREWADESGGKFTAMVMPNTFGPYGKPYFNSVVSTFCYRVARNEQPEIIIDAPVELIYINSLCREFYRVLKGEVKAAVYTPPATATKKVSEILDLLLEFRELYVERGIIPAFKDEFEFALFNAFHSYLYND
ncbi:MAG: NAD-dependent epimerase/dehydratase family protein [Victivallaceae bacterium]|nr:NAD-dependent epimerase/dehydratase family protein [Victivallaceae bacterium]